VCVDHAREPAWRHQGIADGRHIVELVVVLQQHRLPEKIAECHAERPRQLGQDLDVA
jgi:hypothetical protein